jgi:glycosyltransferase involved in cell wall biosynthesis
MTSASPKPKLAIVSTYSDLCGIASYTRALRQYLSDDFDIEIFDLDQYLLRANSGHLRDMGDRLIADFCARFAAFDAVNLQLEYGTLGDKESIILGRLQQIITAAPAISVTFHTILPPPVLPHDRLRHAIFRFELWNSYTILRDHAKARKFRAGVYDILRAAQKTKPVSVIVHTPRDARAMRLAERITHVFDHPLAYLTPARAAELRDAHDRKSFPPLDQLGDEIKIIGVFGFLNEYKGIHTAIKALGILPAQYHLAIFGGLHPGEIRKSTDADMHPYLGRLLGETHVDEMATDPKHQGRSPRDLSPRIHFMGVLDDDALTAAMAVVDIVVLPYKEVGQASSGPMSLANEMGAKIVASRNHAFLQFAQYFPDRLAFFDAGNHLELAQRVQTIVLQPVPDQPQSYNTDSNRATYLAALTAIARPS